MQMTLSALKNGPRISPKLYGIFLEDINYGCDGGLYAELVANRCFENVGPQGEDCRLLRWTPVGGASLSIGEDAPRGEKNPHYLRMTAGEGERWGVRNEGYVREGLYARSGAAYRLTLIARARRACTLCAALVAADGRTLAQEEIALGTRFEKHTRLLHPATPGERAFLTLTAQGEAEIDLDYVSLFPADTFKGRANGARADLAQALADLHPSFLRFPGGCIVEGRSYENMYRFRDTLGPVEDRRPNWNRWQLAEYQVLGRSSEDYFQSYGMGFYEFFVLCEDIGAAPLPVLNCGLTCQWHEALTVPLDEMDGIVRDYMDLIEFCNGDAGTPLGAVRAQMGHPAPFGLKMIGVGNEQWDEVYFERYEIIHRAVKARHPEIELVGCAGWTDHGREFDAAMAWMKRTDCRPDYSDEHYYKRPEWFFENAARYADYDPQLPPVFAGEYAAHTRHDRGERRNSLYTALAEAAFLTGVENAAPNVAMSCYAPLLSRIGHNQWQPDLIWFDEKSCLRTPNYYVQQLFSLHRGDRLAELTLRPAQGETLYATAAWRERDGALILKAVNAQSAPVSASIALPQALAGARVEAHVLTHADRDAINTLEAPDNVVPVRREGAAQDGVLTWTFDAQSVSVLVLR